MQTSATSCLNLTKWLANHASMTFLRKEVPVWFPSGRGSAGMPYQSIPSHFEPWIRLQLGKTVVRPVLDYACPAWHSSLTTGQSKALEAIQRRAMVIIFAHSDYEMSLMLAGLDTFEERRAQLTERFFRRSVLREGSCLYSLLPDKRDSSVTDWLRRAKTFEPLPARTNKFQSSFIPYCLEHFD